MPYNAKYQKDVSYSYVGGQKQTVLFRESVNLTNNNTLLISENVPVGTNLPLNIKNIAGLTSFLTIKADKSCTIKTNSISTPDNTFVLTGSNNNSILYVQTGASLSKSTLVGIGSSESLKNFETLYITNNNSSSLKLEIECLTSADSSKIPKAPNIESIIIDKDGSTTSFTAGEISYISPWTTPDYWELWLSLDNISYRLIETYTGTAITGSFYEEGELPFFFKTRYIQTSGDSFFGTPYGIYP